jgi:hypothetical protein
MSWGIIVSLNYVVYAEAHNIQGGM